VRCVGPTSRATELCVPTIFWRLSADVLRPRPHCLQSHFKHRAEVIQGVGAQDSRAKPLIRVPGHGGRPRRVARRDRHRAKRFDSMTLYRWPLGDWPELPLLEGSDWLPPPDRAPVGARFVWGARPSVDWPARPSLDELAPALP
jgi:hypothetical protein